MKKVISLIILLTLIVSSTQMATGATNALCNKKTQTITFSGGTRTVISVWTNLNDPTVRVEVVAAKHQVGLVDSLENIAKSADDEDSTVLAAINGSFFNAYEDMQPSGTVHIQGETVHVSNSGSVFGIDGDNHFSIEPLYVKIEGGINGNWEWPDRWEAWNFNHLFSTANSSAIFTPAYGVKTPIHTMTSIVVEQNVVTQIIEGQANIPSNGFVFVTGFSGEIDKFQVGYSADYRVKYYENSYDSTEPVSIELDWDTIRSGVGAGPTLVKDAMIVVDAMKEGFKDPKITEIRATRSFIGVTKDNVMVMGVVSNVNIKELAEITLNMGLLEAMNLDGGGSSGLYYSNEYLFKPGRQLSNAIVIKKMNTQPVRVFLNSKELFFDAEPYFDSQKRTMVPMRKLFEALGATVTYDGSTNQIIAVKDEKTIQLTTNSSIAIVDGQSYTLDSPVVVKNNRSLVPIRFITEQFGGTVTWHKETNSIDLTLE